MATTVAPRLRVGQWPTTLAMADLDIRFVTPVPLPTAAIAVELADDDRHLRVTGPDGTVHLAGRVVPEGAA